MLTIIDLGISNIGSVVAAFRWLGAEPVVSSDPCSLAQADAVVLPGVGAFRDGMMALRAKDMLGPLQDIAEAGKPLLGLCLGMQLLADTSEEHGEHRGLGLIRGRVVRLEPAPGERVPNIGWCDVTPRRVGRLFAAPVEVALYFVHSYHLVCDDNSDHAASIRFGNGDVTAAVERENVFGLQCHPEKSQDAGLEILGNFLTAAGVAIGR